MNRRGLKANINREIYWAIDYCDWFLNNQKKDAILASMQFDWIEGNIQYALNYLKQL